MFYGGIVGQLALLPLGQKDIYRNIRNYLAGRLVGATRDKALLEEVSKCLFCKAYINKNGNSSKKKTEDPLEIAKLYRETFFTLRKALPNIFDAKDELSLDPASIHYVDEQLSSLDLENTDRDPIGDLYESFASSALRQQEGQFFTPQNAVKWLVEAIDPQPGEKLIDPACGAGGFLSYAAKHLKKSGVDDSAIAQQIFGIEKDRYLAHLARAHLAINTLYEANILCGDSLAYVDEEQQSFRKSYEGKFDIVLANPPFGAKIDSASDEVKTDFELAYKWRKGKDEDIYTKTNSLASRTPPQVLFIERMASLLKDGGRMGFVSPESLLSSSGYAHVVQYLREVCDIKAVVGMPESLFKSSGKGGTHTKTCLVIAEKRQKKNNNKFFMAEAKWCGHDSRGKAIPNDDLPQLYNEYKGREAKKDKIGYWVNNSDISNNILAPRYYDPEVQKTLEGMKHTHDLVTVEKLLEKKLLSISTGHEPGKLAYGTGEIPFVRTSDISNWEIKIDPKHCVSEEIYQEYGSKQDVKAGDILMVRDGTYLIGSCAFVSKYDEKIIYQSHLLKFRCNKPDELSPFLLLALLSSDPVQAQIKAKRFTQDIIDSIGNRIKEVILPIPKSAVHQKRIVEITNKAILERIEARELARKAKNAVLDASWADESNLDYISAI